MLLSVIMGAGGDGRLYDLQGTPGFPITENQNAVNPDVANVVWRIGAVATGTNGTKVGVVQFDDYNAGTTIAYQDSHNWNAPLTGFVSMWVRLTDVGTTPPSSTTHALDGTTWHPLTEDTTDMWWNTDNPNPVAESSAIKVEIATDSGGVDIVGVGYYRATVSSAL